MNWSIFRTRRWILTTLFVLLGIAATIRLGIWQLDRLDQRRAFNARVTAQMESPRLDLNRDLPVNQLYDMEYRGAVVKGHYNFAEQVALRNQAYENQPGYHLLTPLLIDGSDYAVLVDRGWIPFDQVDNLSQFDEPGDVTVQGVIRRPQSHPDFGGVPEPTLAPGQTRLEAINLINVEGLQPQVAELLLPVYLHQDPSPTWKQMPYREQLNVELSEGPHMGYAIQWFIFAAIMALGYPYLAYREMHKKGTLNSPKGSRKDGREQEKVI